MVRAPVYVLRDGAPVEVRVKTGASDGKMTVITAGDVKPVIRFVISQKQGSGETQLMLAMRGIQKIYGEGAARVAALAGVDLDVAEGEFVAIMGASGSGKSTCMNILGCLDRPNRGSFKFHGVEVADLDNDARALFRRNYLGFVFQGFNFRPHNGN